MANNKILNYQDGPDKLRPCDVYTCTKHDGAVKLRIPETGTALENHPAISIPTLFKKSVDLYPRHTALAYKVDNKWQKVSYTDFYAKIRTCAKAFLKVGLERYHGVCILGFNSPEWMISFLAAIFAGGQSAGIYSTNSPDACFHCLKTSRANICIVEDDVQLQKILGIRNKLPKLRAIVQYKGDPKDSTVYSWKQLMEIGANEPEDNLDAVIKNLAPNECCTLVFTSGTVGNPKAVMLSHDNLTWSTISSKERLQIECGTERCVSYLPLSHVAAQMVDILMVIYVGAAVYFADKDALKGTLVNTLREVEPTRFLAVPRVYEKIREKMLEVAKQNGTIKASIAAWAKGQAFQHHTNIMNGTNASSVGYYIASNLIFKKIKAALGLSHCKSFYTSAAPLSLEVRKYFMSLDMPIMELYGMSEATGAHTLSVPDACEFNSLGKTIPGGKTKLVNPNPEGQGEICMYGRHIFMGYLDDKTKTDEALDSEAWLHTGDIGTVDSKGFVYITGRLKELLITTGGENIAPVPIEDVLKKELPHISNAMLVGDQKKFLSMLITLKAEVDSNGLPSDTLTRSCQEWLKELDCPASTTQEVLSGGPHPNLIKAIQTGIESTNKVAVSNAAKVQKFKILEHDFSILTGELGPTLKLKRSFVVNKYTSEIDTMYS